MPPGGNGFDEWKKYILKELERLGDQLGESSKNGTQLLGELTMVRAELSALTRQVGRVCEAADRTREIAAANKSRLSGLEVKAGIWGAIGASIPSAALLLWQLMR